MGALLACKCFSVCYLLSIGILSVFFINLLYSESKRKLVSIANFEPLTQAIYLRISLLSVKRLDMYRYLGDSGTKTIWRINAKTVVMTPITCIQSQCLLTVWYPAEMQRRRRHSIIIPMLTYLVYFFSGMNSRR